MCVYEGVQLSRRCCFPAFSLILVLTMLLFTSKLSYTDHILWCSTSSPSISQNPSPTLCNSSWPYRKERLSCSLSLIGMARLCMDYQVHVSRFTSSSWGCPWEQMPTCMQCSSQNFYGRKWAMGRGDPGCLLNSGLSLQVITSKKGILYSWAARYKRPCITLSREWSNTDWVSSWKQSFEKPRCCQILFLEWKPGFAKT